MVFGHWPLANQAMATTLAYRGYDYQFVSATVVTRSSRAAGTTSRDPALALAQTWGPAGRHHARNSTQDNAGFCQKPGASSATILLLPAGDGYFHSSVSTSGPTVWGKPPPLSTTDMPKGIGLGGTKVVSSSWAVLSARRCTTTQTPSLHTPLASMSPASRPPWR